MRVLDSATGAELFADRDYGDNVYGLAFAPDGSLVASSDDGQLRRYGPDLKLTAKRPAPDGKHPGGVAIDPSGRRVAVGYGDDRRRRGSSTRRVLAPLARAQTGDLDNGDLSGVAWSRDGATLIAGGKRRRIRTARGEYFLRRFDAVGWRKGDDIAVSDSTIMRHRALRRWLRFRGRATPRLASFSAQGVATELQGPHTAEMTRQGGIGVRGLARRLLGALRARRAEERPVVFDLAAATLDGFVKPSPGILAAKVDGLPGDGLARGNWRAGG